MGTGRQATGAASTTSASEAPAAAQAQEHEQAEPRTGVIPPPPWAREQSPRRARSDKPALSREAIVEAAIHIIDAEGYDAVSMRRLAQEFGTGAASLYAYVANKDELMDLVVDHVMGEAELRATEPSPDVELWLEQVKDAIRGTYEMLTSHRDLARAFLGRIPFGPNGLRQVEGLLNLMRAHGLPDYIAAFAGDLFGQYAVGSAIEDYMWRERHPDSTPESVAQAMGEIGDYLASLPKVQFPNLTEMARLLVGEPADSGDGELTDHSDRFELGLDILVRGIATFLPGRAQG
jgi:TetR/AcrR family tetracycline transcriptional repressor